MEAASVDVPVSAVAYLLLWFLFGRAAVIL